MLRVWPNHLHVINLSLRETAHATRSDLPTSVPGVRLDATKRKRRPIGRKGTLPDREKSVRNSPRQWQEKQTGAHKKETKMNTATRKEDKKQTKPLESSTPHKQRKHWSPQIQQPSLCPKCMQPSAHWKPVHHLTCPFLFTTTPRPSVSPFSFFHF